MRPSSKECEKGELQNAERSDARQQTIGRSPCFFLSDQLIKKKGKKYGKIAKDVNRAAVLGAGIMGGGIAYQSAYKNIPITPIHRVSACDCR